MKRNLYLIDFDGTITFFDSFVLFTFFSLPKIKFIRYWVYVILNMPFVDKVVLKEHFFKNFTNSKKKKFEFMCCDFSNKILPKIIRKSFLEFIKNIDKNDTIVIVSASISNYLKPWCDTYNFDLISTELEFENEKLTGVFLTKNCNFKEKPRRIKKKYDLSKFKEIHVFGNSKGDHLMMDLGTHKYYKYFK